MGHGKIFDMGGPESRDGGGGIGGDKFARAPISRPRGITSNGGPINPFLVLNELSGGMIEDVLGDVRALLKGLGRPPRRQPYTDDKGS